MAQKAPAEPTWHRARPAPVVLISGPEDVLGERAIELITQAKRSEAVTPTVTRLDAAAYRHGDLLAATSPSLFADPGLVVVDGVEAMTDAFLTDALAYVASPDPDVVVVLRHRGGVRGKRLLDAVRASGVEYTCPAVTRDADLASFVAGEFSRAERRISATAVRALVDSVGADVAELAAASAQLMSDVDGNIGDDAVAKYYGTRVNATGYAVADAAIAGDAVRAVSLARHAMETGTDPVPLIAALASKLRTLVKVGAARGRGGLDARELGLAPWQVDRARKDLVKWDANRLATAIEAVAQADADVKGASRAPAFALERVVRTVAELAG
ncbi:DNA polymerase III subunit delta [Demequina sp.]|uniref:DNA polymerase III subunit delta n=1 Tax=Demequina sp. TaxID=2050685 RepID=UPI003D132A59